MGHGPQAFDGPQLIELSLKLFSLVSGEKVDIQIDNYF
jgi:hypothetical protein